MAPTSSAAVAEAAAQTGARMGKTAHGRPRSLLPARSARHRTTARRSTGRRSTSAGGSRSPSSRRSSPSRWNSSRRRRQ